MDDLKTTRFNFGIDRAKEVEGIMNQVLEALEEQGYNPVSQIVGYLLSDDPTYITNHKKARSIIRRLERDEILEEIIKTYLIRMEEDKI